MYTIRIVEKKGMKPEELCSFEDVADAINTFDDVCKDYFCVALVRNNRNVIMQQINNELAD